MTTFVLSLVVLSLVACAQRAEECPDTASCAPPRDAAASPADTPVEGFFGGVLEVRFTMGDATAQDAVAATCGLPPGRRAGLAAAPLPPERRWYPEPRGRVTEVSACLERDPSVLSVVLPG